LPLPAGLTYTAAKRALHEYANPKKVGVFKSFFKTGAGQYGEGDVFIAVTVPQTRTVARQFRDLPLPAISQLLQSKIHEERLLALIILVERSKKADADTRKTLHHFYLDHASRVNNWDLVDTSARELVGRYLEDRPRALLYRLAKSKSLWDRRIAIIATFHFIRLGDFQDTLKLCETFLEDSEDLMAKACGWMLREVGKRDEAVLKQFLDRHHGKMPRVMLRYAIERLSPATRRAYLRPAGD
jgi:3-methyladenine DNA glycosylase AlkD